MTSNEYTPVTRELYEQLDLAEAKNFPRENSNQEVA